MEAVRLHAPGLDGLVVETIETPRLRPGEALVRVHAAAITRDELEWPVDRLPAIPSYELSGVVDAAAADVDVVAVGQPVFALTGFDRDGVAAAYAAVPADLLAAKPSTLDHVASAAVPLAALSAWRQTVTFDELLETAMCHGWVDTQTKGIDDERYAIRYVPRRPGSSWSTRNRELARRLIAEERMEPAGRVALPADL